jgi:DNA-directed RNA polymerase subunit RPC12/RpoP
MEISTTEEHPLVAAVGPFRKFEFRREGENFFHELQRVEIDDAEAETLNAAKVPGSTNATIAITISDAAETNEETLPEPEVPPSTASERPADEAVSQTRSGSGEDQHSTSQDNCLNNSDAAPSVLGRVSTDLESNAESIASVNKKSDAGLPTCVVCLENEGNMVLLPCAHGGTCEECSTRIAQNRAYGGAHCPHCRSSIETLVKLYEVDSSTAKGVEFRIPIARAA